MKIVSTFINILLEKANPIATVYINRPKALNALNYDTMLELKTAFTDLQKDPDIDVIILTGSGDKSFVAGADIAYMQNLSVFEGREFARLGQEVFSLIETTEKPVIAAINGFALGGGCELAMCCDFRVASFKAKFGQPEVGLGIIPGFGGTQRLPRIIGSGMAKQLIYTADIIDANEALRIGLVNAVVPAEELLETVRQIALRINQNGPLAVRLAKSSINAGIETDIDRSMIIEADAFGLCFATNDRKEGMAAFIDKRAANFTKS